jgi:RND family efflux transporter MFP subunit
MKTGWLFVGIVALVFLGWFGVRVRDAMHTQAALASERAQAAKAAETGEHKSSGGARVVTGAVEKWRPIIGLEGTLQPAREAELGFKAAGRLDSIRVRLGSNVRAGDTLATLDDTEARAQVQAAEAQVRASTAQLALADDSARRMTTLAGSGAATEASGVQSGQQKQLASAQLDAARAQLQLARANLKNHTLAAPFGGSVTKVPSGTGAIVNPGQPLFHVSDTSNLKLAATVGEGDASLVKSGAEVQIAVGGGMVKGKVTVVLSSVDAATRRVPVEAAVTNSGDAPLLGGSFVRAQVLAPGEIPVLRLPQNTLRPGSQDEIMVVKDGRLQRRRITFGSSSDGALLVRSGLAAGESVLLAPSPEAQDGDPVQVVQ